MEMPLLAPTAGRLTELLVRAGTQVGAGEALARLEPTGDRAAAVDQPTGRIVELPDGTDDPDPVRAATVALTTLRDLLLGYDEVKGGKVDHRIRFTTNDTKKAYVWPARHQAGSTTSTGVAMPFGRP